MKKIMAFAMMLISALTFTLCGCGGGYSEEEKKNALIIEVHSAGYGTDWIDETKTAFENKTGTKVIVNYQVGVQGLATMAANISSMTSETDLFFMGGPSFAEVYKGRKTVDGVSYSCIYEDLTDLYKSKIDGENKTVEEKMDLIAREEIYFNGDGEIPAGYYFYPYVGGMQGFIKNNDVWDDSWQVPRTTDELFELCNTIRDAKKTDNSKPAPFIYSLEDEYWSSMLAVFITQYEGAATMEKFWQGYPYNPYNNPDIVRYGNNMIYYKGVLKALEFFETLLKTDNGYMHEKSKTTSFTNMQSLFLKGQAVFNCNGDWLEREMIKNYPSTNIEMIKLPVLSAVAEKCSFKDDADKETKLRTLIDYVDANAEGYADKPLFATNDDVDYIREARSFERMGAGNCAVIPCYSNQKKIAKDFLRFMASDEGLAIFRDNTNGCHPPMDYSNVPSAEKESGFRESINKVISISVNGGSVKKDKIFTIGEINPDLFNNAHGRFVRAFTQKDPLTAQQYFDAEVKKVNDLLGIAKQKAGIVD